MLFGGLTLAGLASSARSQTAAFVQVDVSTLGVQANSQSYEVHVSGDGQYVAFTSSANNLVPGDTNGQFDGFVRDLWSGTTERISLSASGQQVLGESAARGISYDGRYVVFVSFALNVHPDDPEAKGDVFLRDRLLGTTELISVSIDSTPSQFDCKRASVSADGRYVAFDGGDSNLAAGDNNGFAIGDVFVRDRQLGTTQIVSVASDGTQGNESSWSPKISADGTRIAFLSRSKTFYPNTNDHSHVFLRDLATNKTHAIDVNPWGRLGDESTSELSISPDGSTIVFKSQSSDLLAGGPFIQTPKPHLWREGEPMQALQFADGRPGGIANDVSLDFEGRLTAFEGWSTLWVAGDPTGGQDIFLQDTTLHVTQQVSANGYDNPANFQTIRCSMSWDGRVIAFLSAATNLVPGTTPGILHAFVRISDPTPGMIYCTPGKSPVGCRPQFALSGQSSASAGSGHDLRIQGALNDQIGLLLYSTTGPQAVATGGGWSCVAPPLRRMPLHATGGSPPPTVDCTGSFVDDFNLWIASGQDPALVAGAPVWLQGWTRDPTAASGALYSDAVAFLIGP
jgi:TolB protein